MTPNVSNSPSQASSFPKSPKSSPEISPLQPGPCVRDGQQDLLEPLLHAARRLQVAFHHHHHRHHHHHHHHCHHRPHHHPHHHRHHHRHLSGRAV